MSERHQSDAPDLMSYLLGELSGDELRDFETALARDPELAREAQELGQVVSRLEAVDPAVWEQVEPPPLRLDPNVLAQAAAQSEPTPTSTPAEPHRERRERRGPGLLERLFGGTLRLQPALGAAVVALVFAGGTGAGLLISGGSGDGANGSGAFSAQAVTLRPVGNLEPSAAGQAQLEGSGRKIRIRVSGLAANRSGDFYEAWMMDAKNGLVSIGSFKVGADGTAEIDVPVPVDPKTFPVVDISLEPADGAPAHSGKSVLRAELS